MLHSMTGFASSEIDDGCYLIRLELKSLNNRYLDIQCRLPENLRHLEFSIRNAISALVSRGKIECKVFVEENHNSCDKFDVNSKLLDALIQINQHMLKDYPELTSLSVADILRFPNVLNIKQETDDKKIQDLINKLLQQVLAKFIEDREREGRELHAHLTERLDKMENAIALLKTSFPDILEKYKQNLINKLKEVIDNPNEERFMQEFVLFMQKADVDEEFSRLNSHITEVRRIINSNEKAVGKRLDFLMQELNREANTLGSKSICIEATNTSVELKVLIEQMREQVQNIE